jgi:hypothetical protein
MHDVHIMCVHQNTMYNYWAHCVKRKIMIIPSELRRVTHLDSGHILCRVRG